MQQLPLYILITWLLSAVCSSADQSDHNERHFRLAAAQSRSNDPSTSEPPPGRWAEAYRKASRYSRGWTIEDKVAMVTGTGWNNSRGAPYCSGNIARNEKTGFPGLCLQNGPTGIRNTDRVSVFPAGLTTAATFSPQLAYLRGKAMGEQFRARGVQIVEGPGVNLQRSAANGRNFEYFGADPWLAAVMAHETIRGIQSVRVQACAKHFIGNEQEMQRENSSSNIDPRTLREIYAQVFLHSIRANVSCVMTSKNQANGVYMSENDALINGLLKEEMGFQGFTVSDWWAAYNTTATANHGLDMSQPGPLDCCKNVDFLWGANLVAAVKAGTVSEERLSNMVLRILAPWFFLRQDAADYPKQASFNNFDETFGPHTRASKPWHAHNIRQVAAAGTVLLKNVNGTLPLAASDEGPKLLRKMAVVGNDAGPSYGGSRLFKDGAGHDGVQIKGWGSSNVEGSYLVSPYEALQRRAIDEGIGFEWAFNVTNNTARAKRVSDARIGIDAAVVFVYALSGEEYITVQGNKGDRKNLTLWDNGDQLIRDVASVQNNTIVVIHAPGQVDVEAWIEHENVTAVLHAHFPGSEAGNAITDLLFGDASPSGRLPYTMAHARKDYPADVVYFDKDPPAGEKYQINYTEGLFVDYRHFDAHNITPRFPFGFGLSYTTFDYSKLQGQWLTADGEAEDWSERAYSNTSSPRLPEWLFEDVYRVSFRITNTGKVSGWDVPQLYLGLTAIPGEPPKILRAFDRVFVRAGGVERVSFTLSRQALSMYRPEAKRWVKLPAPLDVLVGASSRDIRLRMRLT